MSCRRDRSPSSLNVKSRAPEVHLDGMARRDPQDVKDPQGKGVLQDELDLQENLENKASLEHREKLDVLDLKVHLDCVDQADPRD